MLGLANAVEPKAIADILNAVGVVKDSGVRV
jgi:hypothetical protein